MRVIGRSKDWSNLSAYLDGEISIREKAKLEKRLQTDPELLNELNQLKTTRAMIRSLPHKEVPHNFTLTPEMVKAGKKRPLVPLFSFASLASGLIAVVLLIVQFFPDVLINKSMVSSEQAAVAVMDTTMDMEADQTAAPEIIYWGGAPTSVVALGKGGGGPVDNTLPYEAPAAEMEESMPNESLMGGGAPQDQSFTASVPEAGVAASEPMTSSGEITTSTVERSASIPEEGAVAAEASEVEQESITESSGDTSPILGIRPDEGNEMTYGTSVEAQTSAGKSNSNVFVFIFIGLALLTGVLAIIFKHRSV